MFINNPIILVISVVSSVLYTIYLNKLKALSFLLKAVLPMFFLISFINPLFNHRGATIVFYFYDGNPFTLESLIYGLVSAFMMSSVMMWFSCINEIMTSDKIIYLFGRIAPSFGLLISMTLRFIPQFKNQFKCVRSAQKCIGRDISDGNIFQRIKNAIRIISIIILWLSETSIQKSDSMKSRGYGLPKRTSFSPHRFEKRDIIFIVVLILFSSCILVGVVNGYMEFYYFPIISDISLDIYSIIIYCAYFMICLIPLLLDIKEDRKWKYIQSKI